MSAAQLLMTVGKKANHFFSQNEYVEENQQNRVTLFWGGESFISYLEKDQREVRNTIAVGLVKAGMRQTDISKVMDIHPRQLSRYVHGDASIGETPGRPALVTKEIREFVRKEYLKLCAEGPRRWRRRIGKAVSEKFNICLKPSTLSALVADLSKEPSKKQAGGKSSTQQIEKADTPKESPEELINVSEEQQTVGEEPPLGGSEPKDKAITVAFKAPYDLTEIPEIQQRPGPIGPYDGSIERERRELKGRLRRGIYSRYAAGLLLNPYIARILEGVVKQERSFSSATQYSLESYVLAFLQMNTFGCNNYESVQELHPDEFGPLVGLLRSPSVSTLYRITPEFLSQIDSVMFSRSIARNYLNNMAVGSRLFYVDGHFQRYYGKEKTLRDYHAQTHQVQKGYIQYALSTQDGSPFLLFDSDSIVSFQDTIAHLMEQLLDLMPEGVIPSVVFDRGGYDRALMVRFAGEKARGRQFAAHYISWDQFDETDYSTFDLDWEDIVLKLKGNDPSHPKELKLKVAEAPGEVRTGIWSERSPVMKHRKLILRQDYQHRGEQRVLCTPFCSSDWETPASELVAQLSLRWRQENVFKMVDEDYGFEYISTYKTKPYTSEILEDLPFSLQELVASRLFHNPDRRRLKGQCDEIRRLLGRIAYRLEGLRRGEKLKTDHTRFSLPKDEESLKALYEEKLAELNMIDAKRLILPSKIKRLGYVCENGYSRLDFSKKWVLDILRAASHNVRRMALNTWMAVYPNWRDYTQRFRDLLNVGGVLKLRGNILYVELKPMPQPKYQKAAEEFVERIHRLIPTTFGLGPYTIRFTFKSNKTNL